MRKLIFIITVLLAFGCALNAQPRSAGLRFGFTGAEATYQHYAGSVSFFEVDLGTDFVGADGFKASGLFNWELAHPSWGLNGYWTWYAGIGASTGYVNAYKNAAKPGFMLAALVQVACEYEFSFPLAISLDLRPEFGYQFRDKQYYDAGWLGLIPTLAVKYKF